MRAIAKRRGRAAGVLSLRNNCPYDLDVTTQPHKVYIVVDPAFGERLTTLLAGVPVWIVDTPTNTPVAHRLARGRPQDTHLTGITTFRIKDGSSPADNLIREFPTIDLYHGPESANPPYTEVEVLGTALTDDVRLALCEYGFDEFSEISDRFRASRQAPAVEW